MKRAHDVLVSWRRFSAVSSLRAQRPASGACTRTMPISLSSPYTQPAREVTKRALVCLFCGSTRSDCVTRALSRPALALPCTGTLAHPTPSLAPVRDARNEHIRVLVSWLLTHVLWRGHRPLCVPTCPFSRVLPLMPGIPRPFRAHVRPHTPLSQRTHSLVPGCTRATKRAYSVLVSCRGVLCAYNRVQRSLSEMNTMTPLHGGGHPGRPLSVAETSHGVQLHAPLPPPTPLARSCT